MCIGGLEGARASVGLGLADVSAITGSLLNFYRLLNMIFPSLLNKYISQIFFCRSIAKAITPGSERRRSYLVSRFPGVGNIDVGPLVSSGCEGYLKPVKSPDSVPSKVGLLKLATSPNPSTALEFVCSVALHFSSLAILVSIHGAASIEHGCQGRFLLMA